MLNNQQKRLALKCIHKTYVKFGREPKVKQIMMIKVRQQENGFQWINKNPESKSKNSLTYEAISK